MNKQPAADHISGSINKSEIKVKNGKLKIKRVKTKTVAAEGSSEEAKRAINDVVPALKREIINKKVRNDINPAKGAHNPVSDTKKEVSDEIRKLGNFN